MRLGTTVLLAGSMSLSACGWNAEPHILHSYSFGEGKAIVTDAKQRVIWALPAERSQLTSGNPGIRRSDPDYGLVGHNEPGHVVCAEPSPDVTQAISEAIRLAVNVDLSKTPAGAATGGAAKDIGVEFGRSLTAAVAQLGERLASIQLLRDKMYRACESYANGAINATTYTTIMGRIDKTMVTLLSAELAAGAYGRELAAISGGASVNGPDAAAVAARRKAVEDAQTKLKASQTALDTKLASLSDEEKKDPAAATKAEREDIAAKQQALNMAIAAHVAAMETSLSVAANSAIGKIGGLRQNENSGSADAVVSIHRAYVDDDGLDAMVDACVAALDYTGPLYSRLIARHTFLNYEPYFDALRVAAHKALPVAPSPEQKKLLDDRLVAAIAAEKQARDEWQRLESAYDASLRRLATAKAQLEAESAYRQRLNGLDPAHAAVKDADARVKDAAAGLALAGQNRDIAEQAMKAARDKLAEQVGALALARAAVAPASPGSVEEAIRALRPLREESDGLQEMLLERVKTGIDNRVPMIEQCRGLITAKFATERHGQERGLRGIADPNEHVRLGRDRNALLVQCADKALALAKDDKLAATASDFLKSCIAPPDRMPAPAVEAEQEKPEAAPRPAVKPATLRM